MTKKFNVTDKVITSKGNIGVITKIQIELINDKIITTYYVTLGDKEYPIHEKHLELYGNNKIENMLGTIEPDEIKQNWFAKFFK